MTAYQLAQRLEGRVTRSAVYRLARGDVQHVPLDTLEALCDVFGIDDPGPLFRRSRPRKR
jgi:DNA-binding Xre family transcriptional regulator